jgi:hypothetical protein
MLLSLHERDPKNHVDEKCGASSRSYFCSDVFPLHGRMPTELEDDFWPDNYKKSKKNDNKNYYHGILHLKWEKRMVGYVNS